MLSICLKYSPQVDTNNNPCMGILNLALYRYQSIQGQYQRYHIAPMLLHYGGDAVLSGCCRTEIQMSFGIPVFSILGWRTIAIRA